MALDWNPQGSTGRGRPKHSWRRSASYGTARKALHRIVFDGRALLRPNARKVVIDVVIAKDLNVPIEVHYFTHFQEIAKSVCIF